MRVAFVSEVISFRRGPTTIRWPITMFITPRPPTALAPPGDTGLQLFVGVTEVTSGQLADLHGAAVLRGARLLTVTLVDPEDSTLIPTVDRALASDFLAEAGLDGSVELESRSAILDRIARRLHPSRGLRRCWNRLTAIEQGPRPPRRDSAMISRFRRLGR